MGVQTSLKIKQKMKNFFLRETERERERERERGKKLFCVGKKYAENGREWQIYSNKIKIKRANKGR